MAKKTEKNELISKVEVESNRTRDDLTDEIAILLNKENSKELGKVAFFLDEEDDPSNVVDWVSTGVDMLDIAIGNRADAGLPCGRIVEVYGESAAGKSLLAANLLATTQKKGGIAVLIDTEAAVSKEFLRAIGVNTNNLLYCALDTVEDIFENIANIIATVRKSSKDKLVTIVVDSLAGATTKIEAAEDYDKTGYATSKALILSKAFRKITPLIAKQKILLVFTNQVRAKMNAAAFSDPNTTSGGKALPFHASVRIKIAAIGKIKNSDKEVIGVQTKATIIKNRMGPPHRSVEFDIFFESGTDNVGSWLSALKTFDLVTGSKSPYTYKRSSGEEIKIDKKTLSEIIKKDVNSDLKKELYDLICEKSILKYKSEDSEEVSYDSNSDEE